MTTYATPESASAAARELTEYVGHPIRAVHRDPTLDLPVDHWVLEPEAATPWGWCAFVVCVTVWATLVTCALAVVLG